MDEVRGRRAASAGLLLALACIARTDEVASADVASSSALLLPADTEIHLQLLEPVASNSHKHGDKFALQVTSPVLVDGVVVIPSGARGEGQVVHAAKGGFGGRAGELILASRSVSVGEQTVKLRSFSAGNGQDRVNLALGLSFVVVGMFVTGKDISLPAGTEVFAKVATDTMLPPTPAAASQDIDSQSLTTDLPSTEINDNEQSQQ